MPLGERLGHGVQDGLDGEFGVALGELAKAFGQAGHEVGTGHVRKAKDGRL